MYTSRNREVIGVFPEEPEGYNPATRERETGAEDVSNLITTFDGFEICNEAEEEEPPTTASLAAGR